VTWASVLHLLEISARHGCCRTTAVCGGDGMDTGWRRSELDLDVCDLSGQGDGTLLPQFSSGSAVLRTLTSTGG
jgi:hypothetical protein